MIATNITNEIDIMKDGVDKQNKKFAIDIKDIALESSDRANQLSRYIDQETIKLNESITAKYEKLKIIFAKFGEQFKNHLVNQENFRKETFIKVQDIENHIETTREELSDNLRIHQKTIENTLKDERSLMDNKINAQFRVLDDKTSKLQEELDSDVEILKEAIENNRSIFVNKFQNIFEINEMYHRNNGENSQKILLEIENTRSNMLNLQKQIENVNREFQEEITGFKSDIEMKLIAEKILNDTVSDDLYKSCRDSLSEIEDKVNRIKEEYIETNKQYHNDQNKIKDEFSYVNDKIALFDQDLSVVNENLQVNFIFCFELLLFLSCLELLFAFRKECNVTNQLYIWLYF